MNAVYYEAAHMDEHGQSCEKEGARSRRIKDFLMEIAGLTALALTLAVLFAALIFLPGSGNSQGEKTERHITLTTELSTEVEGAGQ